MTALRGVFKKLSEEFSDLSFRRTQSSPPERGDAIYSPLRRTVAVFAGREVALLFEPVQHGIQGASTEIVTVPPQFLDHCKAVNRLLRCMVQDMQPNQAGI